MHKFPDFFNLFVRERCTFLFQGIFVQPSPYGVAGLPSHFTPLMEDRSQSTHDCPNASNITEDNGEYNHKWRNCKHFEVVVVWPIFLQPEDAKKDK